MKDWLDIHALADGQLEGEQRASAEALVASSPECKAEFESIRFIKSTLQGKAETYHSSATWAACRQRLVELEKRRRVESFVGRYAWGMCGIFLAAILGASFMNRANPDPELATGDVAKIVSGMAQLSPNRNAPEDMRSWIKNKPVTLDFGNLKPFYWESGLVKGRKVTRFAVADGKGTFSVVVVQGDEELEGGEPMTVPGNYTAVRVEGGNGVTWHDKGFTLLVVGPRSQDEVLTLAESIRLRQ